MELMHARGMRPQGELHEHPQPSPVHFDLWAHVARPRHLALHPRCLCSYCLAKVLVYWAKSRRSQGSYYLGHSVKALTGRWQKGKDVYWYTREERNDQTSNLDDELQAVKAHEEQLMAEVRLAASRAMISSVRTHL